MTQSPIGDGTSVSTFTYAPNGQLLSETDDNGHVTGYTYDTVGRLSSVTDPKNNSIVYAYDPSGNVLSTTAHDRSDVTLGEQVFVTTATYDGLNRAVSVQDHADLTLRFAYDSRGNVVSSVDPRGNETVCVFDGLSDCVQRTCYEGTSRLIVLNGSHFQYNLNTRCTSSTDANGNVTAYNYDSVNRLVTTSHADGTTESLVWSPRSNLASSTDPNRTITTFTYDLNDRCLRKDIALDPASAVASTTTFEEFTYDGLSRLIRGTNDTSMVEYTYDSMGNLEKAKADCIAAVATFDGVGNRLSLAYPGGRVVQCTYDPLDRVATIGSAAPGAAFANHATYLYEGPDRVGGIARANGINTRIVWDGLQNPPNTAGDLGFRQVSRITHQGGGTVIAQRTYTYDANQNEISSVAAPFVPGGSVISAAFRYDGLDRLSNSVESVGGSVSRSTGYELDAMGNRVSVTHVGGGPEIYSMDATLPEPGDFQMNQYSMTPFGSDHYDRNGNLIQHDTKAGLTYYRYDYADRLVEVSQPGSDGTPSRVASFAYDVLGRRISKTIYPPAPSAEVKTQFIYDADSDGDAIIEFRQDDLVVGTFIMPEVDDEVLVAFTRTGEAAYFHGDSVARKLRTRGNETLTVTDTGNARALTDAKGNVLEFYDYDDYGWPTFRDAKGVVKPVNQSSFGNPFLFHGMFWDAEIGSYHDSRSGGDLDPLTGRIKARALVMVDTSGSMARSTFLQAIIRGVRVGPPR